LLAASNITSPPVPETVVTDLPGVNVYPIEQMPVKGLLSASQPTSHGGDILIDNGLALTERRVTLMYELKHIIDGSHTHAVEGRCADFAMNVLMPAEWVQADWQAGSRNVSDLAERYQVPAEAVSYRLHTLGLRQHPGRWLNRAYCQWQPHTTLNSKRVNQ